MEGGVKRTTERGARVCVCVQICNSVRWPSARQLTPPPPSASAFASGSKSSSLSIHRHMRPVSARSFWLARPAHRTASPRLASPCLSVCSLESVCVRPPACPHACPPLPPLESASGGRKALERAHPHSRLPSASVIVPHFHQPALTTSCHFDHHHHHHHPHPPVHFRVSPPPP